MSKVAIVGVEGSGKTVLMAALGELYGQASHESLYLMPENQASFAFMTRIPHKMRVEHQWPEATAIESMKYMKWTVRIGAEVLTELEMLDYPGELYRMAFGDRKESDIVSARDQIHEFLEHLVTADFLIVLLNLKDAMDIGANARNNETVWLTRGIFDYAKQLSNITNRLLVFTQADRYHELLEEEGGPKSVQEKYMPMLSILHPDLECIAISAVDAPELNAPGAQPTADGGLQELMARIVMASEAGQRAMSLMAKCQSAAKEATREYVSIQELDERIAQYGSALDQVGGTEAWIISSLYPGALDDHSDRYGMLKEFAEDIHKVISSNPIADLAGDSPWQPLSEKYDGLSGQLASIRNIKNSFAKKNVHRTATVLFVGFLILILAAAIIGFQLYSRNKTVEQLAHSTGLSLGTSQSALQNNPDAQYEVGNALLFKQPAQERTSAVEWLAKAASQGNDKAQDRLCDFYYNAPLYPDEIPRDASTLKTFKKYAEQGAPWAQNIMGELHYAGIGVPRDMGEALKYFQAAGDAGNIFGLINTGNIYVRGDGVKQDLPKAAGLYQRAASLGSIEAQYNLGRMYLEGMGVNKDLTEAKKWLQQASEKGNAEAQAKLGALYDNPDNATDKNNILAVKWLRQAAEQGNMDAQYHLGVMYERGRGIKGDSNQANQWYRKAFEQGLKRAEQGDPDAQNMIGLMYGWGLGVERNYLEALKWYKKSADQGNAEAQYRIGMIYGFAQYGWTGDDIKADDDSESLRWYQAAAERGHIDAQIKLGDIYSSPRVSFESKVVYEPNEEEAAKWFQKAAEQGNAEAQFKLACLYRNGALNPNHHQDYRTAIDWYRKAAAQGHVGAQENLGVLYYGGLEVRQDYAEALKWFQRAANNNSDFAKWMIARMQLKGQGMPQDYAKGIKLQREVYAQNRWGGWSGSWNRNNNDIKIDVYYPDELGLRLDLWKYKELYAGMGQQGNVDAQWLMGELLYRGRQVPSNDNSYGAPRYKYVDQDEPESAQWYLAAAQRGDTEAQGQLAEMYYNGDGVPKSYQDAYNWFMKVAATGDADAQYFIAGMYQKGEAISQDPQEAFKWYQKAATGGNDDAQYFMGESYRFGRGVKQDIKVAEAWYRKAAKQRNEEAKLALKEMGLKEEPEP